MQVCTNIVETERGVAKSYKGNYTQFQRQKVEAVAQQWVAYEKWNKEVQKQKDIIRRCATSAFVPDEISIRASPTYLLLFPRSTYIGSK